MEIQNLNEIIELLNNVTLDINHVQTKLVGEITGDLRNRCSKLWKDAYDIKNEFRKLLEHEQSKP